jgi:MFS family permease
MESLGASGVMIGLIVTLQQAAMLMQVPGAYVAEHLQARKRVWAAGALLHRLLWIVPAVVPFLLPRGSTLAPLIVLGVVALSSVLAQSVSASWFSWMADLVPDHMRSRFWGNRQTVTMCVFLVATAVSGRILDRFSDASGTDYRGFCLVFLLATVLGCADIVVHLWVPEPRALHPVRGIGLRERILAPMRIPAFRTLTLAFGAWQFAVGLVGSFSLIYLKREFDVSYTELAVLGICASLGTLASGLVWGMVMETMGPRAFGAAALFLGGLTGIAWFLIRSTSLTVSVPVLGTVVVQQAVLVLVVANFLTGAFFSGVALCQLNLLASLAPRQGRTMAMAVHWTLVGLIGALGPFAGGAIADWFESHPVGFTLASGTAFSFFHALVLVHMAAVWFVTLPLLLRLPRQETELSVRFLAGNPLRSVNLVFNLISMSMAASPGRRVKAVRRLAHRRTGLAVNELITSLDDPAAEVREEAVAALGRIGTPQAVEALVQRLEDPETDLAPQIARALRETRSPLGVDALVRRLADGDRETMAESARALGEIGDPRAVPSLLDLLQSTDDMKVLSSSSNALARLGEVAAIYEILPRLHATHNPVLRRSLSVAVADLLGKPGEFYAVVVREESQPGREVPELLQGLREAVRKATRTSMSPQGEHLVERIQILETMYEDQDLSACAGLLFEVAIGLAALQYGIEFGGDAETFVETLIWRDSHFGVGAWYLHMLTAPTDGMLKELDRIEILLGAYFVSTWAADNLKPASNAVEP